MSDIWTMECERCAGTGEQPCNPCDKKHLNPNCSGDCSCPPCSGKGGWWLGVEEMCTAETDCDNIDSPNCSITERHYYPSGAFKGIKSCKGFLYRPLTVEEVAEWSKDMASKLVSGQPWEHLMITIKHLKEGYTVRYKGSPVRLIGRDWIMCDRIAGKQSRTNLGRSAVPSALSDLARSINCKPHI